MKILLISDNYPPENNALSNRAYANSRYLSKHHDVSVLTCFPNYPFGKIFKNYNQKKIILKEEKENIKIFRIKTYIAKKNNGILSFLDYLSFGINSFLFSFFLKKDLIIASSPPLPVAFFSLLASKITFTKNILEIRDIWSDSIYELGISRNLLSIKILKLIELICYKLADKIFCVTETMRQKIISHGINPDKILIRPNGYIKLKNNFKKSNLELHFARHKNYTNFTFIGTIGESQDFQILLDISIFLKNEKIIFNIIGEGSRFLWLKENIKKRNIKNIFLFSQKKYNNNLTIYKDIDYFFSFLKKIKIFESVIPSKIYDHIYQKKITLFYGPKGEASKMINTNKFGFSTHNQAELLNKIRFLNSNKNKIVFPRSNTYYFSREHVALNMIKDINKMQ